MGSEHRGIIRKGLGGARGITRMATSPCDRQRQLAAVGTGPEWVFRWITGDEPPPHLRLSRFESETGYQFEAHLAANGHEVLKNVLGAHEGWDPDSINVIDLTVPVDSPAELATAQARFAEHLAAAPSRTVILQAPLSLDLHGEAHDLFPDMLLCDQGTWTVGEQKAYLDADGWTDGHKIRSACLQAAVSVHILQTTLPADQTVSDVVHLWFRANNPTGTSLQALRIEAELATITETLTHPPAPAVVLNQPTDFYNLPHTFGPTCIETGCELIDLCRTHLEVPVTLPTTPAANTLRDYGITPERAQALAQGAAPTTVAETNMAHALQTGWNGDGL